MSTNTSEMIIKVTGQVSQAQGELKELDRTLKELLKTATQLQGAMAGSGSGAGAGIPGKPTGGSGSSTQSVFGMNATRVRVIERALEQEGKAVERHTRRIEKLSKAYRENRDSIEGGVVRNPGYRKHTDRMGNILMDVMKARSEAQGNIEGLKELRSDAEPQKMLAKLGGWSGVMRAIGAIGGAVSGLVVTGASFYHESSMRQGRLEAATASPGYSLLQRMQSGDLTLGNAAANGTLARNMKAASGTGRYIAGGLGVMAGGILGGIATGAGIGSLLGPPGTALGAVVGGGMAIAGGITGYNMIANRSASEAAAIQEAMDNAIGGTDPAKRLGLQFAQSRLSSRLASTRLFGHAGTMDGYQIGSDPMYQRTEAEVDAIKYGVVGKVGTVNANSYLKTLISLQNGGIMNGGDILGNMTVGAGDPTSRYKSLLNNSIGAGGDYTMISNALSSATANMIGPNGVVGDAFLNALTGNVKGDAGTQKLEFAKRQAGMDAMAGITTGSVDGYQAHKNLAIAMRLAPDIGVYEQNWLASLDPGSLAALAKDGDKNVFKNYKDSGKGMVKQMMGEQFDHRLKALLSPNLVKAGTLTGDVYQDIQERFHGSASEMAMTGSAKERKRLGDAYAMTQGIGKRAGEGLVEDYVNFKGIRQNDATPADKGKGTTEGDFGKWAPAFEKMMRALVTDGDITKGIEKMAQFALPAAMGIEALKKAFDEDSKKNPIISDKFKSQDHGHTWIRPNIKKQPKG